MAAKPDPKEYRWIPEGKGGTFTVDVDPNRDNYSEKLPLGTYDCHTCVGVCSPVGGKGYFLAHINCALACAKDGSSWTWTVDDERRAEQIKRVTKAKLDQEQMQAEWGPVSIRNVSDLVLVCPKLTTDDGAPKFVGYYVVEAIREWLDIRSTQPTIDPQYSGFMANYPQGHATLLSARAVKEFKAEWARQEEMRSDGVGEWNIWLKTP